MKQYKFTNEEIKKIAHELAIHAALQRGANLYSTTVPEYTKTYNGSVEELNKYNDSIKD